MTSGPLDARSYWTRAAHRLRRRINAAALWDYFSGPALVLAALAAAALITLRRLGTPTRAVWLCWAALTVLAAAVALARARRVFFSAPDALLRMDLGLGLHSRLVSAALGVGPWPLPPARPPHVVRLRFSRVATPPLFAFALLVVGARIPVSPPAAPSHRAVEPPAHWREIEDAIQGLKQEALANPDWTSAWEERLDHLRRQPESAWYSHGSLEAGDTLHQELTVSLHTLGEDLDRAADALEAMESRGGPAPEAGGTRTGPRLDRAVERLEAGRVALDPRLLSQLKAASAQRSSHALSMQELTHLRRRLREGSGFCKLAVRAVRECPAGDPDCLRTARRVKGSGRGGGEERTHERETTAPLTLDPEASPRSSERMEGVGNEDLQHAALGDTIGVSRTAQKVDRGAYRGPVAGGAASSPAGGGETVWRDAWTPDEQRVLERYFK